MRGEGGGGQFQKVCEEQRNVKLTYPIKIGALQATAMLQLVKN